MMNLKSYTPPPSPKKLTHRELLDELVRTGHRPYICGDVGFGVVIAWATSVYIEVDLRGEPGFKPETKAGWVIPMTGLVPDVEASINRVADALGCDNVRQRTIEPSLVFLLSSSVQVITNDFGELLLKPLAVPSDPNA
jgi:hypothetical protein